MFRDDLRTDFAQRQVGSVRQQPKQVRFPLKGRYRQMILTAQDGDLGFRIFDYCGLTIRAILHICRDRKNLSTATEYPGAILIYCNTEKMHSVQCAPCTLRNEIFSYLSLFKTKASTVIPQSFSFKHWREWSRHQSSGSVTFLFGSGSLDPYL